MTEFAFPHLEPSIAGRNVLLSGGTGGLGSAAAIALARDGANLICGYRSDRTRAERLRAAIRERFSVGCELIQGDIGEASIRRRCIDAAEAMDGGLYGLVCYTGDPARVKFEDLEEDDLLRSFRLNCSAPLLLAKEAGLRMRARQTSGAIVFISSMQSTAVFESSVNYAAPKSALQYAALILAKQWGGRDGIRVNVVAPGVNRAGMALKSIESGKYDPFVDDGIIPRFGRPEDTARLVRLLLEPDNYITGQVITVDGGLTLRRG